MYVQSFQPVSVADKGVLHVITTKATMLTIKVLDIQGKIAKTLQTTIEEGSQQILVEMNDLITGNYVLNAFSGDVLLRSIRFTKK
jgi:hypothetical protein